MANYLRAHIPGGTFFFTAVTWQRQPIFASADAVGHLRAAFRHVRRTRPFGVDAMVVLPDHLHCIWQLPVGDGDYAGRWREIKKATSRAIAPESGARRERPVWQPRFWEHAIRDADDWRRHVEYIHYNPVKHGWAPAPGEWSWSSFRRAVARGWHDADWGASEPQLIRGMEWE